ncbi:hypothetical protein HMPREF1598_00443 [Escherichia coli 907710]|nr:hypothetical protein HMPREF1590_01341 [Escherichia coli 113302]ESD28183.1 hypothetical protein HMPREF1598_00443 [Escherichia coli 907710]
MRHFTLHTYHFVLCKGIFALCPQSLNPNQQEDGQCPIRW